jgi:hypothetical protein
MNPALSRLAAAGGLAIGLWATSARAQQILIDNPVRAGELVVFPDLNDAQAYYYVNDKPHLAVDGNGEPQFSFLRWVQNVHSAADQPQADEGEGGGIVHAVVSLSVSDDQRRQAQQELQRVVPGAQIHGPVVYRSGRFGLVAAVTDSHGGLSSQVLGLGKAPILDNEKAAVSILLTKQGAKVLWESFKTRAPDIGFTFEMEMGGFRSPHRGVIEADFDQIYQHNGFSAGIASTYLAAEIRAVFDDLTRSGAIKVTQVGSDEKLEALLATAYNKLAEMMFAPLGGTGTPSLGTLEGIGGGQPNLLDRATQLLQRSREEARAENERIRAEDAASGSGSSAASGSADGGTSGATTSRDAGTSDTSEDSGATDGGTSSGSASADAGTTAGAGSGASAGGSESEGKPRVPPGARGKMSGPSGPSQASVSRTGGDRSPDGSRRRAEVATPSFAVVAAFEMKSVRQRGKFRIDLNKYTADSLTLRFDENIGDLRSLRDDATHFREVNLEDPLFKQREIVVSVDGFNAQDFGQFVNFVTVHLRKHHASGAITDDEVRIDRKNFNAAGNAFKLLYGWNGDNDRRHWFDYDYLTTWSFFGGNEVELPLQIATQGQINLSPPYQRRSVEIQGDPAALATAKVRAVTVRLYYPLGGQEQVRQVTLNAGKGQLSERIEFMLPAGSYAYEYEISWRFTGGKTATSGRRSSSDAILFVDDIPSA